MRFVFEVVAEVERDQGLFAPRDDIAQELMSALESADPGSISGVGANGDSEYSVVQFEVEEVDEQPAPKPAKAPDLLEALCSVCHAVKPFTKFPTVSGRPGVRDHRCRECRDAKRTS